MGDSGYIGFTEDSVRKVYIKYNFMYICQGNLKNL